MDESKYESGTIMIDKDDKSMNVEEAVLTAVGALREEQGETMDPFIVGLVKSGITSSRVETAADGSLSVTIPVVDLILAEVSEKGVLPEDTQSFKDYLAKWRKV